MAREITVTIWCDGCMAKGLRTPGIELPALSLLPSRKPRILAMCDPCKKDFYVPLLDLLNDRGQAVGDDLGEVTAKAVAKAKAVNEPVECPAEGCGYTAGRMSAMRTHVRQRHHTTFSVLSGAETPYACPECDARYTAPQGLSVHRRHQHDIAGARK
jgi:hypothetical protein